MSFRFVALAAAIVCGVANICVAQAADKADPWRVSGGPAVDGFNGKIGAFGGSVAERSIAGVQGSFSIPLAHQWGLQIDDAEGAFDGRFFAGAAAHLFWRDPSAGLLGLYGAVTYWDNAGGLTSGRVGIEGARYWHRFTLSGVAGVEDGNSRNTVTESFNVPTRGFGKTDLSYYPLDDWRVGIGHRYTGGRNALALGTEFAVWHGGARMGSLFAEARVNEGGNAGSVFGGFKVYFGQREKTLIARHRQDDPPELDIDWFTTQTNASNKTALPPGAAGGPPPCCR